MAKYSFGSSMHEGFFFDRKAVSTTTALVSQTYMLEKLEGVSVQLVTTATVAGAWLIEISNDFQGPMDNATPTGTAHYTDVTALFLPTIGAVSSGGSNQFAQIPYLAARAWRVTFTPSGGTGTVSAYVFAKGTQ